jgi:hypothetical protein
MQDHRTPGRAPYQTVFAQAHRALAVIDTTLARFSHTAIPGSATSPARRGAGAGFDALDDIVVKPIA